jgi:O-antigen/teichoic acid export membrane protein
MTNTRTIARNTGWFGLENAIGFVVGLFTPIMIARNLGPTKTGHIIFITLIASMVSNIGSLGIPATTRKYMAEFIGMGDRGTARFIYLRTFVLQIGLATLATGGLLFWVLMHIQGEYRLASALLVLSVWPAMINFVSAQANAATENLAANMPASVISILVYFIGIVATVVLNWGVVGVGASLLMMRSVDFLVRLFPTMKRVLSWETTHVHPPELRQRMIRFACRAVASMAVALIVWDRSEVILLEKLCADIRQVAFYSVAFSMAERLLIGASSFGSAASATIFAQYGRDKSRLPSIAASTVRYLALTSIPLHFIFASLAIPVLLLLFGHKYEGAAMVFELAPVLCLSKAFLGPAQSLLESSERQAYVIAATVVAGIIDISVAWSLIPSLAAVGACIANGAAQMAAVGVMWVIAMHLYNVKLPWLLIAKVAFISVLASLTAHFIAMRLALLWGILLGGSASLIVLFGLFYLMRVLEPEDRDRFGMLIVMLPKAMVTPAKMVLGLLIRPQRMGATEGNLQQ